MKTIFYSFSTDARQSQKANLWKLLRIREEKGIIKRIKRGKIIVQDDHYDKTVEIIKRYNGLIDNYPEASGLSDNSTVKKLSNEIKHLTEKFDKLNSKIFKLNNAKEIQRKEIVQINEYLETFGNQLSTISKVLSELKNAVKEKTAPINNIDLENIVQNMTLEIKRETKGRLDDLELRINVLEERAEREVYHL